MSEIITQYRTIFDTEEDIRSEQEVRHMLHRDIDINLIHEQTNEIPHSLTHSYYFLLFSSNGFRTLLFSIE
jgi:hypothetical protein